ncbi:MAG: NUDIX domain-containing protein, partial [Tsuneonella sp.]
MPVVAAAIMDAHGRFLLQQRPPEKQHGGLWEFPGGKVEPG